MMIVLFSCIINLRGVFSLEIDTNVATQMTSPSILQIQLLQLFE